MAYDKVAENLSKAAENLSIIARDSFGIIIGPTKKILDAKAEMMIERHHLLHKYKMERLDLAERAKNRIFETEITRQFNLEKTFAHAAQLLPDNATPENINKDWLHHYINSSRDVGEEDLRKIWAHILAGEATKPGRFSKRTLDYLKNFSVNDCKLFEKFLPFILMHEDTAFFYNPNDQDYFTIFRDKFNFNYLDFSHLIAIGIIGNNISSLPVSAGKHLEFYYFNKKIRIFNQLLSNDNKIIRARILTEVGDQLTRVVDAVENKEFLDFIVSGFKNKGLEVNIE